jgi:hypothetical protein
VRWRLRRHDSPSPYTGRQPFQSFRSLLFPFLQGDPLDGPPFVCGIITLLKQFHSTHTHSFIAMAGQYVRSHLAAPDAKVGEADGVVVGR